jgi:hypothetical protein
VRTLTRRELNRALLARQLLLERARKPLPRALETVGGIQAQYAPSMYIGLWSRLEGFERAALTGALEDRSVVQATLMRSTIHLVSREDYWPFALATREAGRASWLRSWVDLVRAPPSGTWERRRADRFALAEDWIGPPPAMSPAGAAEHLVRRYLAGFGPASRKDVASFTGIALAPLAKVLARIELRRFAGEDGEELLDLPDGPLPGADTPAPPRLLPTWDANLLIHARRAGVLPEEHRPKLFSTKTPQSFPSFLIDGAVAGTWRYEDGAIALSPFAPLAAKDAAALRDEADRLAAWHA